MPKETIVDLLNSNQVCFSEEHRFIPSKIRLINGEFFEQPGRIRRKRHDSWEAYLMSGNADRNLVMTRQELHFRRMIRLGESSWLVKNLRPFLPSL